MATKKRTSRSSRRSSRKGAPKHGNAGRTSRGRFAGEPVRAVDPGMNPFAPQDPVRLESRWSLGDVGAVYEFNIKMPRMNVDVSEEDYEDDARTSLREFKDKLRKKYPRVGEIYQTGRSGGWLAVQDPRGKMTKATLKSMVEFVKAAKRQFIRDMEQAWPMRRKKR